MDCVDVIPGGKTDTKDGSYDCRQQGDVVGISFKNDGNQDVKIEFGGGQRILNANEDFTHFTNYPYVNRGIYRYTFQATAVVGLARQELNIYVLKRV